MSFEELFKLCENTVHVFLLESAENLIVYRENGSETARTYAAGCGKGILTVGSRIAVLDTETESDSVDKVLGALNLARSSEANGNCDLSLGIERKL